MVGPRSDLEELQKRLHASEERYKLAEERLRMAEERLRMAEAASSIGPSISISGPSTGPECASCGACSDSIRRCAPAQFDDSPTAVFPDDVLKIRSAAVETARTDGAFYVEIPRAGIPAAVALARRQGSKVADRDSGAKVLRGTYYDINRTQATRSPAPVAQ